MLAEDPMPAAVVVDLLTTAGGADANTVAGQARSGTHTHPPGGVASVAVSEAGRAHLAAARSPAEVPAKG